MHVPATLIISLIFYSLYAQSKVINHHDSKSLPEDLMLESTIFNSLPSSLNLSRRADAAAPFAIGVYHPIPLPVFLPPIAGQRQPPNREGTRTLGISVHEGVQTSYFENIRLSGLIGHGAIFIYGESQHNNNRRFTVGIKFRLDRHSQLLHWARGATRIGTIYYYLVLLPSDQQTYGENLASALREAVPGDDVLFTFEYYEHQTFTEETTEVTLYSFVANQDTHTVLGYSYNVPVSNQLLMALNHGVL